MAAATASADATAVNASSALQLSGGAIVEKGEREHSEDRGGDTKQRGDDERRDRDGEIRSGHRRFLLPDGRAGGIAHHRMVSVALRDRGR